MNRPKMIGLNLIHIFRREENALSRSVHPAAAGGRRKALEKPGKRPVKLYKTATGKFTIRTKICHFDKNFITPLDALPFGRV